MLPADWVCLHPPGDPPREAADVISETFRRHAMRTGAVGQPRSPPRGGVVLNSSYAQILGTIASDAAEADRLFRARDGGGAVPSPAELLCARIAWDDTLNERCMGGAPDSNEASQRRERVCSLLENGVPRARGGHAPGAPWDAASRGYGGGAGGRPGPLSGGATGAATSTSGSWRRSVASASSGWPRRAPFGRGRVGRQLVRALSWFAVFRERVRSSCDKGCDSRAAVGDALSLPRARDGRESLRVAPPSGPGALPAEAMDDAGDVPIVCVQDDSQPSGCLK